MPKNILQDVLAKERRTIRQVPLRAVRESAEPEMPTILYEHETLQEPQRFPASGHSWVRYILWGAAGFGVLALVLLVSWSFSGATIVVTPKDDSVVLNRTFTAIRSGGVANRGERMIRFDLLSVSKVAEKIVAADAEKRVSERASGTIVIYNNFNAKPQRLIKNTRFQTADGLIYRIDRSVIVPGQTQTEKGPVPGQVEAVVYADEAGEGYNIALADFTVPGFRNDPARYKSFYARSKIPMTGGRAGLMKVPSEEAERGARESLAQELRAHVLAAAKAGAPEGYLLFPDAVSVVLESLPIRSAGKDSAVVAEKIVATAYMLNRSELAAAIASLDAPSLRGLAVEASDLDRLSFSLAETSTGSKGIGNELRFSLKGVVRLFAAVDAVQLVETVAGREKNELTKILSAFPSVRKAEVVLRPFWSRSFPENPKRINVEVARTDH